MTVKQQLESMWDRQHRCPDSIVGWLVGERSRNDDKKRRSFVIFSRAA